MPVTPHESSSLSPEEEELSMSNGNGSVSKDIPGRLVELMGIIIHEHGSTESSLKKLVEKITTRDCALNRDIDSLRKTQSRILDSMFRLQEALGSKCTCPNSNAVLAEAIHRIVDHLEQVSVSNYSLKDSTVSVQEHSSASTRHSDISSASSHSEEGTVPRGNPKDTCEKVSPNGLGSSSVAPRVYEASLNRAGKSPAGPTIANQNIPVDPLAYVRYLIAHLLPRPSRVLVSSEDIINSLIASDIGHPFPEQESIRIKQPVSLGKHTDPGEQPNLTMDSPSTSDAVHPPPTIDGQTITVGARRESQRCSRPVDESSPKEPTGLSTSGLRNSSLTELGTTAPMLAPIMEEQMPYTGSGTNKTALDRVESVCECDDRRPANNNSIDSKRSWGIFGAFLDSATQSMLYNCVCDGPFSCGPISRCTD